VSPNALAVSLSRGDGTFTNVSTNLPVDTQDGVTPGFIGPDLADFRHSGHLDVAIASLNNAYMLRSHGDGTFDSTATALPIPGLPSLDKVAAVDIAVGDFDGDGNPDFAVLMQYGSGEYDLSTPTSAAWVFYGNGDGTFSSAVLAGTFDRDAQNLSAGDLNGDGLADLVLTSYNVYQYNGVLIVHALPNRAWGPEVDYTGGDGLSPVWITDINHDGRNDLIFSNALRGNYAANSISVLLNQPDTVVTGSLIAIPEPSYVTYPFNVQATLAPPNSAANLSGSVTFLLDGAVVGTVPLTGNTATINLSGAGVAVGTHSLSASWPGDGNNPALTLSGTHAVVLVPVKVSLASSANPGAVGQSVTFSVQVQAQLPPGLAAPVAVFTAPLTLYDGSVVSGAQTNSSGTYTFTTSALASGVHAISASYPGDPIDAPGVGSFSQTIEGVAVSMLLSASQNPVLAGNSVNLSAQLTSTSTCPSCAFTAEVQFSDGGTPLGSAPVNASGIATLPATFTTTGSHPLLATYPGDNDHQAASATLTEQVDRANTSLTLTQSASPVTAGTTVTFTAHIIRAGSSPGLTGTPIAFSDGAIPFATIPADSTGTAIATSPSLAVGVHTITATLAQTASLNASSASISEVVTPAPTVIGLSASPNPVYQNNPLTLNVSLTTPAAFPASGVVQLLDGSTVLSTPAIASNAATFSTSAIAPGTHTLTAVFAGDPSNLPSTSAPVVVTVLPSDFTLTSTPQTISLKTEHHLTFSVTAASVGHFSDRLILSTALLPDHMTVQFDSSGINLAGGGTGTVSVYMDTDDVLGYATATPPSRPGTPSPSALWAFLPAPFLLLFVRRRKSVCRGICMILLAAVLIPLSGCSSLYPKSTAPGTYTIQIHAASATTGLAHTLNLQVTVTP
jgi:hypothetical protein